MTDQAASTPPQSTGSRLSGWLHKASEKVPAIHSLQSTLREKQATFNPHQPAETLKLQLLIKSTTSIVQSARVSSDAHKLVSKNLVTWGEAETALEDKAVRTASDRLAYFLFKEAEVEEEFGKRVEESRVGLKDIRNFQNDLIQQHQKLASLQKKAEQAEKKDDHVPPELTAEITDLKTKLATFTQSLSSLKQTHLRESYQLYLSASRERGEKLALIASYGEAYLGGKDLTDEEWSASVGKELEEKLKSWKSGAIPQIQKTQLGRVDSTRFSQTHAAALSSIPTTTVPSSPRTPPISISHNASSLPIGSPTMGGSASPLNPSSLPPSPSLLPSSPKMPTGPTLLETGPVLSGTGGPKSGQLERVESHEPVGGLGLEGTRKPSDFEVPTLPSSSPSYGSGGPVGSGGAEFALPPSSVTGTSPAFGSPLSHVKSSGSVSAAGSPSLGLVGEAEHEPYTPGLGGLPSSTIPPAASSLTAALQNAASTTPYIPAAPTSVPTSVPSAAARTGYVDPSEGGEVLPTYQTGFETESERAKREAEEILAREREGKRA